MIDDNTNNIECSAQLSAKVQEAISNLYSEYTNKLIACGSSRFGFSGEDGGSLKLFQTRTYRTKLMKKLLLLIQKLMISMSFGRIG